MEGLMYPIPFSDPDELVRVAEKAEDLGFDSIGGNDHIVTQDYVKEEWPDPPRYYDIFNTFSYVAARTEDIKLNTAVTVLPLRDPIWVAKQATTLDHFSNGRLILGTGVGAYREEFEAIHPDVELPRGLIMDESVEALDALLGGEGPVSYDGKHVRFKEVDLHPKPVQEPFPLYVGGNHDNAIERAVRWGQGWLPAGLTPAEIEARKEDIHDLANEYGRDPEDIDVAPQLIASIDPDPERARGKFEDSQVFEHLKSLAGSTLKDQSLEDLVEDNLIGSPAEVIPKLERYVEAGVTHFPAVIFAANDIQELVENMEVFGDEVVPEFE